MDELNANASGTVTYTAISGSATDATINLDALSGELATFTQANLTNSATLSEGFYDISIEITDQAGNVGVGTISNVEYDITPPTVTFTFDNNLYLTSGRKQKGRQNKKYNNYTEDEEYVLDVYKYDVINKVYLNEIPFDDINTKYHEGIIAFSSSGDTMYFARETYYSKSFYKDSIVKNGSTKKQVSVINLYRATRCTKKEITWKNNGNCNFNDGWDIKKLEFNSAFFSIKNPALSCDGKTLYYSSDMPGGFGNYDIYKSELKEDGTIGSPVNLGQKINTEEQEVFLYQAQKESKQSFLEKWKTGRSV